MIAFVAALVTAFIIIVGTRAGKNEYWTYPAILIGMPFIYVAFALYGDPQALTGELLAAIPFVAAGIASCFVSIRNSVYLLAFGWLAHGLYDLFLHDLLFVNAGTPSWYGMFCGIIDVIVCAYLISLAPRLPEQCWINLKHDS